MVYLDHAATTPVRPEARAAMLAAPSGNPSSLHASGRAARRSVEESRETVAELLDAEPGDVLFTSGGTVADNLAVRGVFAARQQDRLRPLVLVSAVEHHAVLDAAEALTVSGAQVLLIPVDPDCRLRLESVAELLRTRADDVALVSVMSANNEVGTGQPLAELAALLEPHGIPLHTDAVQSVGWWGAPGVTSAAVSLSAHKFGGPIGSGALVLPTSIDCRPIVFGGGQERQLHSGTLDPVGAAGMAAGLAAARASAGESGTVGVSVAQLKEDLAQVILTADPEAEILTPTVGALPNILSVAFPECESDALLMLLDAGGVECSAGSACTAGIPRPSHVVAAMGREDVARSVLRFSLGWTSTTQDVATVGEVLPEAVSRARRAGRRSLARSGT